MLKDGIPQTEEVEVKIPAFRAVTVFDVSQTGGEPIPVLEANELFSTVEGYEDFIKAITYVAPVSIDFEDIPGDSKGYFSKTENRIAVQEGMGESQTLKTMVHETAHSMLHNKEVNQEDILAPEKDRNMKEVEAESIAYTVCQHFGIDTSDYSFAYIAGWSSGRDMKELKSSLDTIRRTASELITGIEGQLKEIQRERKMMQDMSINGQEKESLLLIQNSDLSEYSLLCVMGMDVAEIVESLSAMNDDDKLSIAAYLESRGAWTTEVANEGTREFREYHLDVRYNTDTNEIVDLKAKKELDERARASSGAVDAVLGTTHSDGLEAGNATRENEGELRSTQAEQAAGTLEFEDMDEGDEFIDLGDEKDQVLAEMKKLLGNDQDISNHQAEPVDLMNAPERETELAFQIANRFICIQEIDGGYDYSIIGADYKEIDGGVYDNPDISIREALNVIVEDIKENPFGNGVRGNIRDNDELIPIDYEHLMGKMEAVNRINPEKQGIIENFKAKTNELFHEISEMNPTEIEETIKCHVQAKLEEYGIDAVIIDAVVVGSRCRGLEREDSDLDVVVELSTDEREDTLFDTFNKDGLHISGIKVDINPITAQRTGTLDIYLPQVENYLTEMREAKEKEPVSIFNIRMNDEERWFKNTSGLDAEGLCKAYAECGKPFVEMEKYGERIEAADHANIEQGNRLDFSIEFNEETDQITIFDGQNFEHKGLRETLFPEQAEPEVTLTVAECGEFPNIGEYYENISTVDEAIAIWRQIPPDRVHGIPAININIHMPGTEPIEDVMMIILFGEMIDLESLDYYPDIKGNAQAMELITELLAKLPDMEIAGIMSTEMEAAVWEKRMPDLTPAEQLAVEIDRFLYNYDRIDCYNNAGNMPESVSDLSKSIRQNDISHITEWLASVITEGAEPGETRKAMELLEKLAEYKPLAKIEEMEEQNYNMVDNVLNNGAGGKNQKEALNKRQEVPMERTSLRNRLAEKKEIVSGKGKDCESQENIKNEQREM